LGPGFAALMLAGRVGSGIAAELGSMKVTEQIDAIRSMGIEPVRKLVVPRVLAATLLLPVLALIADVVGILGGLVVAVSEFDINAHFYLSTVRETLTLGDVMHGLTKAVFFGFFIALIGCYNGLRTSGGTVGVGRNTTQSVVISSIVVLVSDYFLTKFLLWL
ncbi:MAG: MlaE family ABC transporter permease, partial [Vicinamibacteria bacterium]